jgi:pimeloyl-ACP methyl ester carboxylesterase
MKKRCLLIPGNPAVADYYLSWIQEIENRRPDMDIKYANSYVLFDRKLNYEEYDSTMRNHYKDIFLDLKSTEKVILIAHSVGSYFAFKLLEMYPEQIDKVIVLFPYIGYSSGPALKFTFVPYMIDRFFPLVEMVSRFKNLFHHWDPEIQNISDLELTACLRFGVRQCTYFNKYKLDTGPISQYKDKIHFLFTANDRWCPTETIELLKPISNFQEIDLPHDFIVNSEYRDKITKLLDTIVDK